MDRAPSHRLSNREPGNQDMLDGCQVEIVATTVHQFGFGGPI